MRLKGLSVLLVSADNALTSALHPSIKAVYSSLNLTTRRPRFTLTAENCSPVTLEVRTFSSSLAFWNSAFAWSLISSVQEKDNKTDNAISVVRFISQYIRDAHISIQTCKYRISFLIADYLSVLSTFRSSFSLPGVYPVCE